MRGNGLVDPLTDRPEMIVGLPLEVGVMEMAQAQDQEDMQQQIDTERRCGQGP
jgi:hypothetical protein